MTKKKETAQYNDQSIEKLEGADRVRLRPAVIFGSDGLEGCEHAFFEILSNSVDEAREGYGSTITVTVYRDHSIEVDDRGRGIPMGYNEKYNCYNWELIYCELYAGGKYKNNSGMGGYEFSLGLNGLGACATQYASEFFEVHSFDGKHLSHMSFRKGNPVGELEVRELEKGERRTGTVTYWRRSPILPSPGNIMKTRWKSRRWSMRGCGSSFGMKMRTERLRKRSFCIPTGSPTMWPVWREIRL